MLAPTGALGTTLHAAAQHLLQHPSAPTNPCLPGPPPPPSPHLVPLVLEGLLVGAAAQAHGVEEAAADVGAAHGAALGATHTLEVLGQDAGALRGGGRGEGGVGAPVRHVVEG